MPAIREIQPLFTNNEPLGVKGDAGYVYYANGLGSAKMVSSGRASLSEN
jgi:hypothetical protein